MTIQMKTFCEQKITFYAEPKIASYGKLFRALRPPNRLGSGRGTPSLKAKLGPAAAAKGPTGLTTAAMADTMVAGLPAESGVPPSLATVRHQRKQVNLVGYRWCLATVEADPQREVLLF
jgi:hypothetical protein